MHPRKSPSLSQISPAGHGSDRPLRRAATIWLCLSLQAMAIQAEPASEPQRLSVILNNPADRTAIVNFNGQGNEQVLRWLHDDVVQTGKPRLEIKAAGTGASAKATPEGFGKFVYEVGLPSKLTLQLTVLRPGLIVSLPQSQSGAMITPDDNQSLAEDAALRLMLRNPSGPFKSTVRWQLRIGASQYCEPPSDCIHWRNWPLIVVEEPGEHVLKIEATGSKPVAQWSFMRLRDWLLESRLTSATDPSPAVLSLAHVDAENRLLGVQTVKWRIARTPRQIQFDDRVKGMFWAALGVLGSFLMTFMVPNIRRKITAKRLLELLAGRIRQIPEKLPSAIKAGLRSERIALNELRKSVYSFWPRCKTVMDELEPTIARLDQRVSSAEELSRLLVVTRTRADLAGPPLSRYLSVRRSLDEASLLLMDPKDTAAAAPPLKRAAALLNDLTDEEQTALAASVQQRLVSYLPVRSDAETKLASLIAQIPKPPGPIDLAQWVGQRGVGAIDSELLLLDASVGIPFADLPIAPPRPTLGQAAEILSQLSRIKAKPLADRVRAKLATARIALDRESPRAYEPIAFSLEFDDPTLQLIAPQSGLVPLWEFTDPGAIISEWTSTRYFLLPRAHWRDGKILGRLREMVRRWSAGERPPMIARDITVTLDGKQVATRRISLASSLPRRERNLKQLVLLLATVLPVLITIVWQATDISPLALITLGFTADRVKEALAGTSS